MEFCLVSYLVFSKSVNLYVDRVDPATSLQMNIQEAFDEASLKCQTAPRFRAGHLHFVRQNKNFKVQWYTTWNEIVENIKAA